jgi:hypothetical protein
MCIYNEKVSPIIVQGSFCWCIVSNCKAVAVTDADHCTVCN